MINISERRTLKFYIFNKGGYCHEYQKMLGDIRIRLEIILDISKKDKEKNED